MCSTLQNRNTFDRIKTHLKQVKSYLRRIKMYWNIVEQKKNTYLRNSRIIQREE